MNAQDLRNSILQLAVQGQLVEQRPEEGTARELLKQIRAEKEQLIKEKKIKKEQPLPEIAEEEIPFEIPESWEWVRVADIFNVKSAMRIHQTDWQNEGVPFFRGRELVQLIKTGRADFEIFISQELYERNKQKGGVPQKNDILVTAVGTIGKSYIVQGTKPFYYKDAYILCFENIGNIYPDYIKWCLDSPYMQNEIYRDSMATTVAQLTIIKAKGMLIPFPPIDEQKRIVAKIEEILPYIEQYDKAHTKLEIFNKKFPEDMKKSILQLAMQGKLVEQRPEEGTADELYGQIAAEKARLIKEGKIKAEKPLPEIGVDEIPFEIPKSWRWVRFGNAISLLSGTDFKPEEYNDRGIGTVYITGASNIDENGVIISRWTEKPRNIACQGDVLLVCKGSGYGKTVICNIKEAHIARQIMSIKKMENLDMKFIKCYLDANFAYLKSKGQGVIPGIDRNVVLNMIFPLPPIEEQQRIVKRLGVLLPLCNRLSGLEEMEAV